MGMQIFNGCSVKKTGRSKEASPRKCRDQEAIDVLKASRMLKRRQRLERKRKKQKTAPQPTATQHTARLAAEQNHERELVS